MPNTLTASPGLGGVPFTVARIRCGVSSGETPLIRTGAKITRAPDAPGLSTSITHPSTTVGRVSEGAIGAATASLRALATASPDNAIAIIRRGKVTDRAAPKTRDTTHPNSADAATSASGHNNGSVGKPK